MRARWWAAGRTSAGRQERERSGQDAKQDGESERTGGRATGHYYGMGNQTREKEAKLSRGEPNRGGNPSIYAPHATRPGRVYSSHVLNTCLAKPPLQPLIPVEYTLVPRKSNNQTHKIAPRAHKSNATSAWQPTIRLAPLRTVTPHHPPQHLTVPPTLALPADLGRD